MLELVSAYKRFGEKVVLKGVSLGVRRGETVFVLGRSGQGKSVILRSLVGLESLDEGEVRLEGKPVDFSHREELGELRRRCGLVFQLPALLDSLTVEENLLFGVVAHRLFSDTQAKEYVRSRLPWVGLNETLLSRFPRELAFGVQKRVALLRSVLLKPDWILFDEPTTGMDPENANQTDDLISRLVKQSGAGALVVSHDLRSALRLADRILLLDQGNWVFSGTPSEFRSSDQELAVRFRKGSGC